VIVLDENGKIAYRVEGFSARGFAVSISAAVQKALSPS